jgi:sulfate permease, SulP family
MPVITGFTAGIAVIIASSQVGDFLGLTTANLPAEFIPKWTAYFGALGSISVYALAVGSATLAMILLLRRFARVGPIQKLAEDGCRRTCAAVADLWPHGPG